MSAKSWQIIALFCKLTRPIPISSSNEIACHLADNVDGCNDHKDSDEATTPIRALHYHWRTKATAVSIPIPTGQARTQE